MNLEYLSSVSWWERVDVRGPDDCWLWLQSAGSHGYGQTWDSVTVVLAHRVAWALTFGDPGELEVLHRCPNGPNRQCCNPGHLALGTDKDNANDRERDGNTFRGEQVTISKLTEQAVRDARAAHAAGQSIYSLAKEYGVAQGTMRPAILGVTWKHVE